MSMVGVPGGPFVSKGHLGRHFRGAMNSNKGPDNSYIFVPKMGNIGEVGPFHDASHIRKSLTRENASLTTLTFLYVVLMLKTLFLMNDRPWAIRGQGGERL